MKVYEIILDATDTIDKNDGHCVIWLATDHHVTLPNDGELKEINRSIDNTIIDILVK